MGTSLALGVPLMRMIPDIILPFQNSVGKSSPGNHSLIASVQSRILFLVLHSNSAG